MSYDPTGPYPPEQLAIVGSKSTSSGSASATSTHDRQGPASTGNGGIAGSGTVAFAPDHAVKWNDKIEASVLSVQRFTPSKTAAGTHAGQVGIKVTVKITNNSTKQFDLTLAGVNVKSGANGTQADTISDSANNLGLGLEGSVG